LAAKLIQAIESTCRYAILDGAISPAVRDLLKQAGVFYQSLYEGEQAGDLAAFGPYLVEIRQHSQLLPFLIKVGWGRSWGIFLETALEFIEVRKHLRHFLLVDMPDRQRVLFRY
jgi:hypothetical protein